MQTLDFAKLHESTLVMHLLPEYPSIERADLIKRAALFFAAAMLPKMTDDQAHEITRLEKVFASLSDQAAELITSNQLLNVEIVHRKEVEVSLKKSERHHLKSLEKSNHLKEQLRKLSRQILSAQEDERKKISRELHDVIAQELMGINVQLAALKSTAEINAKGLNLNIARTQKRVMKSASIIHEFARELRPTALDDLGLVPALHSFLKSFTERTGIRTYLTAFAGVDQLNSTRLTTLYRVAQEALCNTARHANASRAEVVIRREGMSVHMEVKDNGKSFDVHARLSTRGNKHLGLLGMRERVEMVGGIFRVESSPGKGSTIIAQIPVTKTTQKKWELAELNLKPKAP